MPEDTTLAPRGRGLNIVVYDKTKDKVISSRIFDTWLMQDER